MSADWKSRGPSPLRIPVRLSVLALVVLAASVGLVLAQTEEAEPITPEEAADHVGTEQAVCGKVVDAAYVPEMDGRPTFLNFGQAYPDQVMSAVIFMNAREEFPEPPEEMFRRKNVCVTGVIEETEQGVRIVVEDPEAIVIQKKKSEEEGETL